jgi:imidazolonepropionase
VLVNGNVATLDESVSAPYGAVRDGVVAVADGRIAWIGPSDRAPRELVEGAAETVDLEGGWVTPGLVDAHTHLLFGGTRAAEFEQRLGGATYEELARAGGGILSTVRATRNASRHELERSGAARLACLVDHGVTTVEIKSGYGLDVEHELRMLEVARALEARAGITVSTTLLGAHALPLKYADDRGGYLDLVCDEMIPEAALRGLADAVDAFCEGIGFTPDECARVLHAGRDHGLAGRLHADQLSDLGGAALAARLGARSADHLEHTSDQGVRAMAEAGTAAVLLPGAFYFLRERRRPPVDALRAAGVPLVVATDLNPGSSPVASPLMALNLACVLFGLTPEEALIGMTRAAAPVLGFEDRGIVREGARADLACWRVDSPAELAYWIGANPCTAVISGGRRLR